MRVLLVFVVLLAQPANADNDRDTYGYISGYVRDASTGETLAHANVVFEGNQRGTTTDLSGAFLIERVPPGLHEIRCTYLGYEVFSESVRVGHGETVRLDIELKPDVLESEGLTVVSDAFAMDQRKIGVAQLTTEAIRDMPAMVEADVFRSLQMLPGIASASDFSSGLYIRGGGPDQTLIMLDGTPVYNPTHFFGFYSVFNSDAIRDVTVHKGGYPAELGGRLGSVVDVRNRDGNREKAGGSLRLGLLATTAMLEGPHPAGSWIISGRRSTLEPYLALLRSQDEDVPHFFFYDVNTRITFDAGSKHRFTFAGYLGTDDVDYRVQDDLRFVLEYGNRLMSAKWEGMFFDRILANLAFTGSQYFNYPLLEFGGTHFERSNHIEDMSVRGDIEVAVGESNAVQAGFRMGTMELRLNDWLDGSRTLESHRSYEYGSAYIQGTLSPVRGWYIVSGLRGNHTSDGDEIRLEPRLSMEYHLTESMRFQAAYGRYYQFLTLMTSEAFSGFDVWLPAGGDVKPAFGDQYVFAVKTRPASGYHFDLELYYRTMRNLFELDPRIRDYNGLPYQEVFRYGEGLAFGAEVFAEKVSGPFTGFIAYTFGRTERTFDGFNDNLPFPPKYDRLHDLNVALKYQLGARWEATALFSYATGQAYTEILGQTGLMDDPIGPSFRRIDIVGQMNAARLPPYHRLDLGLSRQFSTFAANDSRFQLQVVNVYSRRNAWFYQYDRKQTPPERTTVRMLPVLPSVTYTINF